MLNDKHILITGGTGSFGKAFCRHILKNFSPKRLIVYSRDEYKQAEMMSKPEFQGPNMRFFLGDVRDRHRLIKAMKEVDYVIHAAALKQVPAAEYNPHEFIQTNISGSINVVDAAIECNVSRVIALSTDKAVGPINLYGATKLCAEKVFVASNSYSGKNRTRFSVVRYGNVLGSRGSVIPLFLKQKSSGTITITDARMTRFFITLEQGVAFVLQSLEKMEGGEIFIPKLKSCRLTDIAEAVAPDCTKKNIGIRPGEKLHEALIPAEESNSVYDCGSFYILAPLLAYWTDKHFSKGTKCPDYFSYNSESNDQWLSAEEIRAWVKGFVEDHKNENHCTEVLRGNLSFLPNKKRVSVSS